MTAKGFTLAFAVVIAAVFSLWTIPAADAGDRIGNAFPITTNLAADQGRPAVAYNPRRQEYMVAWIDASLGVFGRLYDADGLPLGRPIYVPNSYGGDLDRPTVSYDPRRDRYLAVWQHGDIMKAGLVTADGQVPASVFLAPSIAGNYPHASGPAVSFHTTDDSFLLVYEASEAGDDHDIGGCQVRTGDADPTSHDYPIAGDYFHIYEGDGDQSWPDVAYNPNSNEFLVVWQGDQDGDYNIYARLVSTGTLQAAPEGAPGRVQAAEGWNLGDVVTITTAALDQLHPDVVYNPDANEYLVTWQSHKLAGAGTDIHARRIDGATGQPASAEFAVSTSAGVDHQRHPDVAYIDGLDRYRVVWHDDRDDAAQGTMWDIRGQWISSGGSVLGAFDDVLFRYPKYQIYPAIAYGSDHKQALVVWQDGRSESEYDLYARLGALDTTPPQARFTVDDTWGREGDEFAFNARPSADDRTPKGALQVRWDFNGDGVWETEFGSDKYITRTVHTEGVYTITLEVQDLAWLTDTVSHRIVVLPAGGMRPAGGRSSLAAGSQPTATLSVSPTYGYAGDTFSFDAGASVISGTALARWDWENDGAFDTSFGAALSTTQVYTTAGDHVIRVELRDESGLSNATLQQITVVPTTSVGLEVWPPAALVPGGSSRLFRATAWDTYDNVMYHPTMVWTVMDGSAGAIDTSGIFTASTHSGVYTDVIHGASGTLTDTASVTVFWPHRIYLPLIARVH